MSSKRIMSEYPVKSEKIRNRKKKEKMDGFGEGLKPRHQPYRRNHHNYLLDDMDVYDPVEDEDG